MVFSGKERNLEDRIKHPNAMSSSNYYTLDEDVEIKIEYVMDNLEYKEEGLYGNLVLFVQKWDEDEKEYVTLIHEKLEKMLLVDSKQIYFNSNVDEIRRINDVKKEYVDLISMKYEKLSDEFEGDWEDIVLVPSMFEDTLDNLFDLVREQYKKTF